MGGKINMELCDNEINKIGRQEFIDECLAILADICDSFNYSSTKYKVCGLYADFCKCAMLTLNIKKVLRVLKANGIKFELTTENELFTTIKLKDVNTPKTIHVATLERG